MRSPCVSVDEFLRFLFMNVAPSFIDPTMDERRPLVLFPGVALAESSLLTSEAMRLVRAPRPLAAEGLGVLKAVSSPAASGALSVALKTDESDGNVRCCSLGGCARFVSNGASFNGGAVGNRAPRTAADVVGADGARTTPCLPLAPSPPARFTSFVEVTGGAGGRSCDVGALVAHQVGGVGWTLRVMYRFRSSARGMELGVE